MAVIEELEVEEPEVGERRVLELRVLVVQDVMAPVGILGIELRPDDDGLRVPGVGEAAFALGEYGARRVIRGVPGVLEDVPSIGTVEVLALRPLNRIPDRPLLRDHELVGIDDEDIVVLAGALRLLSVKRVRLPLG